MNLTSKYVLKNWYLYYDCGKQVFDSKEECKAFLLFLQHYGQSFELAKECPSEVISATCLEPYNWGGTESLIDFMDTFRYATRYEVADFDNFVDEFIKNAAEEWEIEYTAGEIATLKMQEPCGDDVLLCEEDLCFHIIYC